MKKIVLAILIIAACVALSANSYAGTEATTFDVSVNFVSACSVSTTGIDFGNYDGIAAVYANGEVQVTCPDGLTYNVTADQGLNYDGQYRYMSDSTDTLAYLLLLDTINGVEWGDYLFGNTYFGESISSTGTGTANTFTIFGELFGSQTGSLGTYNDVVTVTVHY